MAHNFCSGCGANLDGNANFCASCGQKIKSSAANQDHGAQAPPQAPMPDMTIGRVPAFHYPPNETHSRVVTHQEQPQHGKSKSKDAMVEPTVEFKDLHPRAMWLFYLSYLKNTIIVLIAIAASAFIAPLVALALPIYLLVLYLAATVTYKNFRFEITPVAFRKEYGILHKQTASIPFSTVQNVSIRRSVLDQMLGLAHVDIETAGTGGHVQKNVIGGAVSSAEGHIPGIAPDEASDIKNLILLRASPKHGNHGLSH